MPSIPGVATSTVFVTAPKSFGGSTGRVRLEVRPTTRLVHTETGTPLADFTDSAAPAEGAVAEIALPNTDQPGFQNEAGESVTGWTYEARVFYRLGAQERAVPPKRFRLPAGQARVDLATAPDEAGGATMGGSIDGGGPSTIYTTTTDGGTP